MAFPTTVHRPPTTIGASNYSVTVPNSKLRKPAPNGDLTRRLSRRASPLEEAVHLHLVIEQKREQMRRLRQQYLGRNLTSEEKRLVSLAETANQNLEANLDIFLDPPPPKAVNGE